MLCALLLSGTAHAQSAPPLPGRFEIAAGGLWVGRTPVGTADATLTDAAGGRFRLFATESQLDAAPAIEGRVGIRLLRRLEAEGSVSYAVSNLSTRIGFDFEGAADVTATESVKQVTVEAGLVAHLEQWRLSTRTVPFVSGGAGYLRQLHEGHTLVETGRTYHIGGGINSVLRWHGNARLKAIGLRVDARAIVRTGGVAFDEGAHAAPAFGASLFFRF
jgi:hypothetical protein